MLLIIFHCGAARCDRNVLWASGTLALINILCFLRVDPLVVGQLDVINVSVWVIAIVIFV